MQNEVEFKQFELIQKNRFMVVPQDGFPFKAYTICRCILPEIKISPKYPNQNSYGLFAIELYQPTVLDALSMQEYEKFIEKANSKYIFNVSLLNSVGDIIQAWEIETYKLDSISYDEYDWRSDDPALLKLAFRVLNFKRKNIS